jgi:hypothetical protein
VAGEFATHSLEVMKNPTTSVQGVSRSTAGGGDANARCGKISRRSCLAFVGLAMVFTLLSGQPLSAASRADTLQAINWVENPFNRPQPGASGELGAYQFRASTWRMHTKRPFAQAIDRRCSDEVAVLHYEWIRATLLRAGIEPTVYNIAVAWNAGTGAVVRSQIPPSTRDYATRVNNLAVDLGARTMVAMK